MFKWLKAAEPLGDSLLFYCLTGNANKFVFIKPFVKSKTYPKCHRKGLTIYILKTDNQSLKTTYNLTKQTF